MTASGVSLIDANVRLALAVVYTSIMSPLERGSTVNPMRAAPSVASRNWPCCDT